MAKQPQQFGGSWVLAYELLERGDPGFVEELRGIHEADRLGKFAPKWYGDQRPEARRLLLAYLDRPLNAIRHEPLVKRLFKLAEGAGDDAVLARFLVLFDRSVRRTRASRYRYNWSTRRGTNEEYLHVPPGTTMPRPAQLRFWSDEYLQLRLFSVPTRNYLRRRAWRYFRKLGKKHPERYLKAITTALQLYRDEDVADGVALLDNWGLIHVLYHYSPVLRSRMTGWVPRPGRGLNELQPAPIHENVWRSSPQPLLEILEGARCRPVRQWTIQVLRRDHPGVLDNLPLDQLVSWLGHESADLVGLAIELLRNRPGLEDLGVQCWLDFLERAAPETLDMLCELASRNVRAEQVALEQAADLARKRSPALARLGFAWLQGKTPGSQLECETLLRLRDAEAESLRPELVRWVRGVVGASPLFQTIWVLEFLDSRHLDVRAEGWAWLQEDERVRQDMHVWQKLMESPYDDIRLKVLAFLEEQVGGRELSPEAESLNPEMVWLLWATVLLNVQRGSKQKPVVVRQLVQRMARRPAEARELLPILSVALRSVRGPEFRTALAAVVQLLERRPELEPVVQQALPELQLEPV